jgi:hypothetical protein
MQGDKFCANQLGQPFDEVLLGREVIVEGGDVHPGASSHRAGAQAFKAHLGDYVESSVQQGGAALTVLILGVKERAPPVAAVSIRHTYI